MKVEEYAEYYIDHEGFPIPTWGETDPKGVASSLARLLKAADAVVEAIRAYDITLTGDWGAVCAAHDAYEAVKREEGLK